MKLNEDMVRRIETALDERKTQRRQRTPAHEQSDDRRNGSPGRRQNDREPPPSTT